MVPAVDINPSTSQDPQSQFPEVDTQHLDGGKRVLAVEGVVREEAVLLESEAAILDGSPKPKQGREIHIHQQLNRAGYKNRQNKISSVKR